VRNIKEGRELASGTAAHDPMALYNTVGSEAGQQQQHQSTLTTSLCNHHLTLLVNRGLVGGFASAPLTQLSKTLQLVIWAFVRQRCHFWTFAWLPVYNVMQAMGTIMSKLAPCKGFVAEPASQ
jgi:GTP cyclohydrolase I